MLFNVIEDPKMRTQSKALKLGYNALGFQSAWWLTVLGVIVGFPLLGPLAMTLYMLVDHLSLTKKGQAETRLILSAMLLGTVADTLFIFTGLLNYAGGYALAPVLAPLWITAMWGGFAATLNHSLSWIKPKPFLAFLLGAIFGPLSYMAGAKFGAITFNQDMTLSVMILGLFWGLAIPGLIMLQNRFERSHS